MTPPPPRSLFCAIGSDSTELSDADIKSELHEFLGTLGDRQDVLILPPDYTRFHSQSGKITRFVAEYYNFVETSPSPIKDEPDSKRIKTATATYATSSPSPKIQILPALGTHAPMTQEQIKSMFGEKLASKQPNPFLVHDWRNDVETIGHVPAQMVKDATYGMVNEPWPAQLNKLVWEKRHYNAKTQQTKSLVLSIGQVVPHEVTGFANFNKNLFVGVGGVEAINLSHFIGAVHGMEKMMGRASNPLRSILNYASEKYLQNKLDLWYVLTVMGTDKVTGELKMRGLFIGNDIECYQRASALSLKINVTLLPRSPKRIVVYLDEHEFHSTWLGNKAIYRTRMAIANGGELIILAPGVKQFGEDKQIDVLIRKYGYVGTPAIMKAMEENEELKESLSTVAHLIHGSSEGRFSVTYCPGFLSAEEVQSVGFKYADLRTISKRYDVSKLKDGWNTEETDNGEQEFFYISNPALGLWAVESRFQNNGNDKEAETKVATGSLLSSTNQQAAGESGGIGGWAKPPPAPK